MITAPHSSSTVAAAALHGDGVIRRSLDEFLHPYLTDRSTRVAVRHSEGTLSYAQLYAQAATIAQGLLAQGVEPGDRVGVLLHRDALLVPSLLALLEIGVAYVPLDAAYPLHRLSSTLEHAQVRGLLCSADIAAQFGGQLNMTLFDPAKLVGGQGLAANAATEFIAVQRAIQSDAHDQRLANVIYTSGTTGTPKGVSVSRAAMANLLQALQQTPGMQPDDRVLGLSTIAFDIHVLELLAPLGSGATIVLADDQSVAQPTKLLQLITQAQVTLVQATPSMWGALLAAGLPVLPGTRGVAGGERLAPSIAQALTRKLNRCWNMYGPTEATVYSTAHLLGKHTRVSIGHPLANISVAVVTPGGSGAEGAVPAVMKVGERGELAISGAGLAEGYWQSPQTTAERFVNIDINGTRVRTYLTGDMAFIDSAGNLHCEGRLDQQVKLRGHRVELSEIEHLMVAHPDLSEAACCVHSFAQDDDRLVAYHTNIDLTEDRLRRFVAEHLPPYMVPQRFLCLSELPRLPSGKLDRSALPRPQPPNQSTSATWPGRPDLKGELVAGRPGSERNALAISWQQLLGGAAPVESDNFMDQGGHSLLAIQLVQMVLERTGKELPPGMVVLENFAELVALLEQSSPVSGSLSAPQNGILGRFKNRFKRLFQHS